MGFFNKIFGLEGKWIINGLLILFLQTSTHPEYIPFSENNIIPLGSNIIESLATFFSILAILWILLFIKLMLKKLLKYHGKALINFLNNFHKKLSIFFSIDIEFKYPWRTLIYSGSRSKKVSCPLSDLISVKLTLAPAIFRAFTIFLLSEVGYNQSLEKEITKKLQSYYL